MAFEVHKPARTWRRRIGSDVWHFMPSCHQWPKDAAVASGSVVEVKKKPTTLELCNHCLSRARHERG